MNHDYSFAFYKAYHKGEEKDREEMSKDEETCRKKSSGNSISRCCNKAIDRNYAFAL